MPRVQCEWSTCKYNNSKYANEGNGECNKEDIVLTHEEATIDNEEYKSFLECASYILDSSKEYK